MKSIGYYINTFLRRSEGFIFDQVKHIRSYNVEVLTRSTENSAIFPFDKVNSIDKNSSTFSKKILFTLSRRSRFLEKTVREKNISLIHAHFGVDAVYALPLAQKFDLPLITTFHGHDITRLPKFTLYPPSWFNYCLHFEELKKRGNLFIAVSDFIKNKLLEKGFPKDKVITHYLGVNINVEPAAPNDEKMILFAGRLVEKKGVKYLIAAAAEVCREYRDTKFLICGDGPLRKELEQLTETKQLTQNVKFLGWKNKQELAALMRSARVLVIPSVTARDGDSEGLGIVLLETMACGLPVIGTFHSGIPEAVVDGENGFLFEEKDYIELSKKIKLILGDQKRSIAMGKKAREQVINKFNISKQVSELEEIYQTYL